MVRMAIWKMPTVRLIAKRILQAIPVVWGVTFITFCLLNLLPGDAALSLLGPGATKATVAALSLKLHLNEPFFVRYAHWIGDLVTGHLGVSLANGQSVASIIGQRLPVTLELVGFAFVISVVFAVPLAVIATLHPHGIIDRVSIVVCMLGISVPGFVLGLILILVFGVHLHLLPFVGFTPISAGLWLNIKSLILPAATLGFALFCNYTRILRADLIDQMVGEDYITTARAKGISLRQILVFHALRNSLFSLITVIGLNLGVLVGGSVLIEQIFALPGMGQELISAIDNRDLPVVEGIVVLISVAVVASNLITDLLYAVLDPRVRYDRPST
jgi:peptide/nickel transport system permease protein